MPEHRLTPEQIWDAALGELRLTRPKEATWLRGTVLLEPGERLNEFVVGVSDGLAQSYLEKCLTPLLQRILSAISRQPAVVRFKLLKSGEDSASRPAPEAESLALEREWLAAGIPEKFIRASLDTLDWSRPALGKPELQDYAARAPDYFQAGVGLTLLGATGVGKTHLAIGLLKKALAVNPSACFISTVTLLDDIRSTFELARQGYTSRTESHIIHRLARTGLLVLDDLRTDGLTAWGRDRLYAILNPRWERGLPTITTSNYTPAELASPPGRDRLGLDAGTLSRLLRSSLTLQLDGEDYRAEQKRRTLSSVRAKPAATTLSSLPEPR